MTLKKIGEFGFIKKISRGCLIRPENIIKAIGDDAAAFTTDPARISLITTDLLVERIHFLRNAISGFDPIEFALSGGEDYTLLCTVSPEKAEAIAENFQTEFNRPLFRVGKIAAGREMKLNYPDGSSTPIEPTGWNHFSDE